MSYICKNKYWGHLPSTKLEVDFHLSLPSIILINQKVFLNQPNLVSLILGWLAGWLFGNCGYIAFHATCLSTAYWGLPVCLPLIMLISSYSHLHEVSPLCLSLDAMPCIMSFWLRLLPQEPGSYVPHVFWNLISREVQTREPSKTDN